MSEEMTRWGVGPKFTIICALYMAAVLVIHYLFFPSLTFKLGFRSVNIILGIILIVLGIPIFLIPGLSIDKYFLDGKLCKAGVYAYMRHPIYGSWIVFIVPGIVLIIGSIIGLSIPVFMYILFRILIIKEDEYLENKFGQEYLEYRKKVNAVFPKLWKS